MQDRTSAIASAVVGLSEKPAGQTIYRQLGFRPVRRFFQIGKGILCAYAMCELLLAIAGTASSAYLLMVSGCSVVPSSSQSANCKSGAGSGHSRQQRPDHQGK